jgi:hypothetical protein
MGKTALACTGPKFMDTLSVPAPVESEPYHGTAITHAEHRPGRMTTVRGFH